MFWTIIGAIAALLTSLSFIPQIVRALRTRSVKDVSLVTLYQLSSGVILWIFYGAYRGDPIIILANSVSLTTLIVLIYLYFRYRSFDACKERAVK